MEFNDLRSQQREILPDLERRMRAVLEHGQYINGPEVRELEKTLQTYIGTQHAIACASGTDALLMSLMALNIGPGDAVFTSSFSFIAAVEAIVLVGATPVLCDVRLDTFNLDCESLQKAIRAVQTRNRHDAPLPDAAVKTGLRPRAVIAVDLFGQPAEYRAIETITTEHEMYLIEDAAQSFGGSLNGTKAGTFGQIATTSFFPSKPLGCYGDGGMCFTSDETLANRRCDRSGSTARERINIIAFDQA